MDENRKTAQTCENLTFHVFLHSLFSTTISAQHKAPFMWLKMTYNALPKMMETRQMQPTGHPPLGLIHTGYRPTVTPAYRDPGLSA